MQVTVLKNIAANFLKQLSGKIEKICSLSHSAILKENIGTKNNKYLHIKYQNASVLELEGLLEKNMYPDSSRGLSNCYFYQRVIPGLNISSRYWNINKIFEKLRILTGTFRSSKHIFRFAIFI